jgi:hypothetical protein
MRYLKDDGNAEPRKMRKMIQPFPSHTAVLWKSLCDSHIFNASTVANGLENLLINDRR